MEEYNTFMFIPLTIILITVTYSKHHNDFDSVSQLISTNVK